MTEKAASILLRSQLKREAIDRLGDEIRLAAPSAVVFGEGDLSARLAVVGEAPGAEEEAAGRPFVGFAGRLLDRLLREVLVLREELWITNLVKWRPVDERDGGRRTRAPRAGEAKLARAWLESELQIIRPCLILCLGNHAARALISPTFQVAADHGRWHAGPFGAQIMATFHPAYAGRFGGREGQIFEATLADFQAVKARYEVLPPLEDVEPVSTP
ncbi:MAG: uracil-DNA glycosylase [Chloroflexi bacterium]|nr:uracil-DNA glycosylase [Chloroflexota bacterium]